MFESRPVNTVIATPPIKERITIFIAFKIFHVPSWNLDSIRYFCLEQLFQTIERTIVHLVCAHKGTHTHKSTPMTVQITTSTSSSSSPDLHQSPRVPHTQIKRCKSRKRLSLAGFAESRQRLRRKDQTSRDVSLPETRDRFVSLL